MLQSALQRLIKQQSAWSQSFDELLPLRFRSDAGTYFRNYYLTVITSNACVYDVGGGRHPTITLEQKARQNLRIVGLDISDEELRNAPAYAYDEIIAADITEFRGRGDADFIVSDSVLEHIDDTDKAFKAFRNMLKPGGIALILVPCRNAIFARLNLLLPEAFKRRILFAIYPSARRSQGWTPYYDRCTPAAFRQLAEANGFDIVDLKPFYYSAYFAFCSPLYALWRVGSRLQGSQERASGGDLLRLHQKAKFLVPDNPGSVLLLFDPCLHLGVWVTDVISK